MSREYNDKFYKKYGANIHSDPVRFDKIASLCKGDVLDLACGTGDLADYTKNSYTGVDISEVAVSMAKKMRPATAIFWCQDVTARSFDAIKRYDTIVLAEFLEHLEDDLKLFENIFQCAKPDTRLIISVPNGNRVPDEDHKRTFTIPELRARFSELGKVKFYNWPGERQRIIFTVDLGQKNEGQLALAIIAKDEGLGIEQTILSAIELADQIVISVDEKSKDETLEIAKNYADVLIRHNFNNDFSGTRNFLQKEVTTKWVLWLDGHEFLKYGKDIDKNFKDDVDGYFVKIRLETGFTFWFSRLIKKEIEWQYQVHNTTKTKNLRRHKELMIQHDREKSQTKESIEERNQQREKMVFEILGKRLKENKKDARAAFYLAQHYNARKEYRKAIKFYKKYIKNSRIKQERWLVFYEIGNCYNYMNKTRRAIKFFRKADKELPRRWEIYKKIGATLMTRKKWLEAADNLVASFGRVNAEFMYNPEKENDAQTWFFLCQCFIALERCEQAKISAREALKENEKNNNELLPEEFKKILEIVIK